MSAPGNVSMLPTLLPPTPVPTKVSTSELGARPAGEVGAATVVGDPVDEPPLGVDGPHPPTITADSATNSATRHRDTTASRLRRWGRLIGDGSASASRDMSGPSTPADTGSR